MIQNLILTKSVITSETSKYLELRLVDSNTNNIISNIIIEPSDLGINDTNNQEISDSYFDSFLDKFSQKSLDRLLSNQSLNMIYDKLSEGVHESSELAINEFMYGKVTEPPKSTNQIYLEIKELLKKDLSTDRQFVETIYRTILKDIIKYDIEPIINNLRSEVYTNINGIIKNLMIKNG